MIDPIWPLLAAALTLLFLLLAAAGVVAAPLVRRCRLLRLSLFGAVYLAVDASLVLCCAAIWVRHPLARRDQQRWSRAHQTLLRTALSVLVGAARRLLGFHVILQEPPDRDRISGHPLLVLARHGGPGDSFALVQLLMSRYQRRTAIVLKETLRWDPGLDVLLGRLPSCFIRPGDGSRAPERMAELAKTMQGNDAILIFPEGGNWTPRRYHRAIARLRGAGRRQAAADAASNPNVLPPRPTGLLACLAQRPDLHVAVVAHTGLEDLVSPALVWRALPVSGRPMVVRWWYEPASCMPVDEDGRREWLRLQWALVDAWIDARKAAKEEPERQPAADVLPVPEPLTGPSADV